MSTENKKDYNDTLNLPKTEFPMRAALPKREPEMLTQWENEDLYEQLMKKNNEKPLYVLHDGPPYANGDIHLGHALNKILKDFVVRYKNMSGFKAPFVPGWDTHGLPTELKARKKAGVEKAKSMTDIELRRICRDFVLSYIDDQRKQFKRLGVLGEWENPYITLQKEFEAVQIETFAKMACDGHIYRGLKPVYWCPDCETALAEAEIEYSEDPCYSIYVKFAVKDDLGKLSKMGVDLGKTYFVIWTTTTWTLPGNVAICVGPKFEYSVVECDGEYYVMASELYDKAMKAAGKENYRVLGSLLGSELEYMTTKHPFLDRESVVIVGDHVTLESGTGCVHTAPGHGVEDFEVCKNYKDIPIIVPVDSHGVLTDEAGEFKGLKTSDANKPIADHLKETGNLFAVQKIIHQYPHCWRCKEPILFRATEQWFCSIDSFKEAALEAIKGVNWIPKWGEDRISAMVRDRKDWCISRQRKWGVPIPIFFCKDCGEPLIDKNVMFTIADIFRKEGSDAWFIKSVEELLPVGTKCSKCSSTHFEKEKDIMDVWFDSGVSHEAVCEKRDYLSSPADLYLEGADQYRGWFQSSLLTSVAMGKGAPYKNVVTHGWVVDGEGHKQSKSLGNGIAPDEVIKKYGADILRLWVASSDYHSDIRISEDILKQLSESYRKIRNTARFIISNLNDFSPDTDMIDLNEIEPIDKWALCMVRELSEKSINAYEKFEFHQVYHGIHNFCVVDMSNFYLDVLKDRLYVEKNNSHTRRAAQTAMFIILDTMTRIIAPILAYTSEEIWSFMPHGKDCDNSHVIFNDIRKNCDVMCDDEFKQRWNKLHLIRENVSKVLELARKEKLIGSSLEASVELHCTSELYDFMQSTKEDLGHILITSEVDIINGNDGEIQCETLPNLSITVKRAKGQKCQRCWNYSETVGMNEKYPDVCARCASILN